MYLMNFWFKVWYGWKVILWLIVFTKLDIFLMTNCTRIIKFWKPLLILYSTSETTVSIYADTLTTLEKTITLSQSSVSPKKTVKTIKIFKQNWYNFINFKQNYRKIQWNWGIIQWMWRRIFRKNHKCQK